MMPRGMVGSRSVGERVKYDLPALAGVVDTAQAQQETS
jgi:hypothetical protein